MSAPRWQQTARSMTNDQVIVAGGLSGDSPLATVDLYDPATNGWAAASH
jgi:hypothetical protein